jgi:hypothetical protein
LIFEFFTYTSDGFSASNEYAARICNVLEVFFAEKIATVYGTIEK